MRISDTGPGIAESEREAVVKRFYRSDKSRRTPGTGLGLSLVAAIARLHDFRLSIGGSSGCVVELACWPHGRAEPAEPPHWRSVSTPFLIVTSASLSRKCMPSSDWSRSPSLTEAGTSVMAIGPIRRLPSVTGAPRVTAVGGREGLGVGQARRVEAEARGVALVEDDAGGPGIDHEAHGRAVDRGVDPVLAVGGDLEGDRPGVDRPALRGHQVAGDVRGDPRSSSR